MNELVTELKVLGADTNLFDTNIEYTIPLYQRAYAWEDKQLTQLIEDINDIGTDVTYYIGALIVSRQNGKFEVVDGQQRLTSLYLLLNCLGLKVPPTLTFACRDKSNYTLRNISELIRNNLGMLNTENIEDAIQRGVRIINQALNHEDFDKPAFIKKLSRVVVYRIEVPENTDLNRYFEIMNTRGEQLEQHDILKATLMGYIPDDKDKTLFAKIWDACSDMTGYVQMHFPSRGNTVREGIFGPEWNRLPSDSWSDYTGLLPPTSEEDEGQKIANIISPDFLINDDEGYVENDIRVRFESIIEFPYFLLHTLRVFIALQGIEHENAIKKINDELLDDKKLIEAFLRVINYGVAQFGRITDTKENFSQKFILCLLRTRYLFDKFIIKREYTNENADGEWSLKSLYVSGQQSKKKPYYVNTKFTKPGEWSSTNDYRTKRNIMIQSALRVSYTSPKVMHWITDLLIWLSENDCMHPETADITSYGSVIERIAIEAVKENFLDKCPDGVYAMGVNTPHIVFNYLDYLLWLTNRNKYDDFTFEFRNSVEHWYPQNPSEGTFEQWKDGVDHFGNLCIIQRNINSKFSNMSPEAKKSTFREMIAKGSIKLRIMSELTEKHGATPASLYWKEDAYLQHEKSMITLLLDACN